MTDSKIIPTTTITPPPDSGGGCNSRDGDWPENVGILAIEIYFPSQYVDQTELETFDNVSAGKYTIGLGQDKMGFCTDREDINSLCMTVVRNLMEKHKIGYDRIGRLEVGTETMLDKSKSVKSVIMQLFEKSGNTDIEGVDSTNACYGGTAALFNSLAWLESSAWDGRLALVVAGDIAIYASGNARPTGGAGAVAMLLGPHAPLVFDRGIRSSHSVHVYDFYKPDMSSEYPKVDGPLTIKCYLSSLDKCYQRYKQKVLAKTSESISLQSFDGVIFHSPYGKLVQKSLARLFLNDLQEMKDEELKEMNPDLDLQSLRNVKLEESYFDRELEKLIMMGSNGIYESKTKPSLYLANQIGNMYTPSVYGCLIAYLLSKPSPAGLHGNRLLLFSYGSGLQASMYSIRITSDKNCQAFSNLMDGIAEVFPLLHAREKVDPASFSTIMKLREENHHKVPYTPVGNIEHLVHGTYYLVSVDEMYRRTYDRKL